MPFVEAQGEFYSREFAFIRVHSRPFAAIRGPLITSTRYVKMM